MTHGQARSGEPLVNVDWRKMAEEMRGASANVGMFRRKSNVQLTQVDVYDLAQMREKYLE